MDAEEAEPSRPARGREWRTHVPDSWYLVLSGFLFVLALSHVLKNGWGVGNDIWEHAAALREFAERPFDPRHPLLAVDAPHQFLNPYLFLLGLVARLTGASPVTVLNLAGMANLLLLLTALWLFVSRVVRDRRAPFYALLFLLFLWGPGAWNFGSFLHFRILPFVLPYPSTFATALALLAVWVHMRFVDGGDRRLLLPIVLMTAAVVLTHPLTAVFAVLGFLAFTVCGPPERLRVNLLLTGGAVACSFVLALLWPFFPLWDLLFGTGNRVYRETISGEDRLMYVDVLRHVWPALFVIPFLVRRRLAPEPDGLSLWLVAVLLAYFYGWWSENWSFGRLVALAVLLGGVVLAAELGRAVAAAVGAGPGGVPALTWIRVSTASLLLVGVVVARNGFSALPARVLHRLPHGWVQAEIPLSNPSDYDFLTRFAGDGQVVLSDGFTPLEAPVSGAKSVSVPRGEAFVADVAQRNADVSRFFDIGASEEERRAIIGRYRASFLLLQNVNLNAHPENYQPMLGLGQEVYRDKRFLLLAL